ncbi:class I SAM-dependent methyltransferase [Candidatus Saccharibacteria bacterium]|nr:MAG: class I SAM-dependent methyltransferase [Candidatus Saccharibacteria bacterium]
MEWLIGLLLACFGAFAAVIFFGAPYLPTLLPQIKAAFDLLELKPGQTILELGCGDGKVLIAAAQAGYQAVGIELNPLLVVAAWFRTRQYKGAIRVHWGNYWRMSWPEADGVFVFLLDSYMAKLDARMQGYKKPLASVTFRIPNRNVDAEKNGVFLYIYR